MYQKRCLPSRNLHVLAFDVAAGTVPENQLETGPEASNVEEVLQIIDQQVESKILKVTSWYQLVSHDKGH